MSEKRRGLGRGLGALIPTGLDGQRPTGAERPVDVFFPDPKRDSAEATASGASTTAVLTEAPPVETSPQVVAEQVDEAVQVPEVDVLPQSAGDDGVPVEPITEAAVPTEAVQSGDGLVPVPGARFAELPVGEIRPNPKQPRTVFDEDALDELVGSIREVGVLQPIVVRDAGDGYELIMGERRWRATQAAGLATIPAIIRDTEDADLLRDALLENLHRSELNPLEEAAAYQQLLDDFGCTHEQLATRIQRSRPQISNTLRLLKLPPLVQRRVAAGVLSAGHARALLGLSDGAAIERLAQRIVAEGLSVRAVEEIVSLGGDGEPAVRRAAPRAGVKNEALDHLAARLSDRFDTRVKVSLGKSRGRLTVEFASVQDLNRILASLAPEDPGLLKG
ncbi:ParB/RepB/Spo0J family partition protein [Cellulomonas sp. ICMP 17802]|uniref:ParB/RepB/Spo0J family partition protein n=1 Tax=Cellulomonas sp. ICMP 17802 TaxID=3239199 RepID=UPI00351BA309